MGICGKRIFSKYQIRYFENLEKAQNSGLFGSVGARKVRIYKSCTLRDNIKGKAFLIAKVSDGAATGIAFSGNRCAPKFCRKKACNTIQEAEMSVKDFYDERKKRKSCTIHPARRLRERRTHRKTAHGAPDKARRACKAMPHRSPNGKKRPASWGKK